MTPVEVAGRSFEGPDAGTTANHSGKSIGLVTPVTAMSPPVGRPSALRIGLIRNPRSHRNKGHLEQTAAQSGIQAAAGTAELAEMPDVVTLAMPGSLAELDETLRGFAADAIDVLAIDGGDGTVRDVLSAAAAVFGTHWPRILLVPKGKTNALAADVGVPTRWQLADGLRSAHTRRTVVRRPVVIERRDEVGRDGLGRGGVERAGLEQRGRDDPDDRPIWGFIFGAGVFNAAIATGQVAHRFGAFQDFAVSCTAAMGMVQALFGFGQTSWRHSARMRITDAAGTELPHSSRGPVDMRYLALFSTLQRFPAGIAPFAPGNAGIHYLMLDAALRRVAARLPTILWGTHPPSYPALGIHQGVGEAFDFELDEGFILDGEAFAPGRIRLRQGPELHFIVP